MNFLIDNDVVYKLAAFNLLDDAVEALNAKGCSISVLETLKFHAISKRRKEKYGEEAISRVFAFIDPLSNITAEISDPVLIAAMDSVDNLDGGEMQLLSYLIDQGGNGVLLSGDKRFIRSLANNESHFQGKLQTVENCFISLEQIIVCILEHMSFDDLKTKIEPGLGADTAVKICFGDLKASSKESVRKGLDSYISDLAESSGNLLVDIEQLISGEYVSVPVASSCSDQVSFAD